MKCKKYCRQGGHVVQYQISQGIVSMTFIAYSDCPRVQVAAALRALRAEVRNVTARLKS